MPANPRHEQNDLKTWVADLIQRSLHAVFQDENIAKFIHGRHLIVPT
jgi:hypothetical protein